jgi:hypothetical protein
MGLTHVQMDEKEVVMLCGKLVSGGWREMDHAECPFASLACRHSRAHGLCVASTCMAESKQVYTCESHDDLEHPICGYIPLSVSSLMGCFTSNLMWSRCSWFSQPPEFSTG